MVVLAVLLRNARAVALVMASAAVADRRHRVRALPARHPGQPAHAGRPRHGHRHPRAERRHRRQPARDTARYRRTAAPRPRDASCRPSWDRTMTTGVVLLPVPLPAGRCARGVRAVRRRVRARARLVRDRRGAARAGVRPRATASAQAHWPRARRAYTRLRGVAAALALGHADRHGRRARRAVVGVREEGAALFVRPVRRRAAHDAAARHCRSRAAPTRRASTGRCASSRPSCLRASRSRAGRRRRAAARARA